MCLHNPSECAVHAVGFHKFHYELANMAASFGQFSHPLGIGGCASASECAVHTFGFHEFHYELANMAATVGQFSDPLDIGTIQNDYNLE